MYIIAWYVIHVQLHLSLFMLKMSLTIGNIPSFSIESSSINVYTTALNFLSSMQSQSFTTVSSFSIIMQNNIISPLTTNSIPTTTSAGNTFTHNVTLHNTSTVQCTECSNDVGQCRICL